MTPDNKTNNPSSRSLSNAFGLEPTNLFSTPPISKSLVSCMCNTFSLISRIFHCLVVKPQRCRSCRVCPSPLSGHVNGSQYCAILGRTTTEFTDFSSDPRAPPLKCRPLSKRDFEFPSFSHQDWPSSSTLELPGMSGRCIGDRHSWCARPSHALWEGTSSPICPCLCCASTSVPMPAQGPVAHPSDQFDPLGFQFAQG